jgi:antitoxin ParD1/3/4
MTSLTIELPTHLADWVARQTAGGDYIDAGDDVRTLLRREAERAAKITAMNKVVADGLASGVSPSGVDEVFAKLSADPS